MTLTLAIPFFNRLASVKGILGQLKFVTSPSVEWLIVDNGSQDPVEDFFRKHLRPKRLNFLRNDANTGLVKTYQQIFDNTTSDLVAILHNDVFIYQMNWDKHVIKLFRTINHLGIVGLFGSSGVGSQGERIQDVQFSGQMSGLSNMLEAEIHGARLLDDYIPAAILDGFAMIFSMDMIRQAGGLDQRYHYHHIYDRELSLTSLSLGYKNVVASIPCHHESGVTANHSDYQNWIANKLGKQPGQADKWTHDQNTKLFQKKWAQHLPLYVNRDFTFRKGPHQGRTYQGAPTS